MKDLSIIIINYRTPNMVIDCLASLLPELGGISFSIIVVDNSSGDNSSQIISDWLVKNDKDGQVLLVDSPDNRGFSSGNNIGITAVESKYYLLLNSDTLIRTGAIKKLLNAAEEHTDSGLITPRLEWSDETPQESCFRFLSPVSEFISSAQTGFITRLLEKYNVPINVYDDPSMPDWSSFACVLIKKEVFDDVGLMDDGYFMYFEDAEFCHRASMADWKVVNEPSARVVHLRGGSSPVKENTKLRKRLPRYFYESRTRYFYQIYGWSGLTMANLLWWAGRMISKIRQLCGRNDKAVIERKWLDIWRNWFHPLKPYTHPDDNN